jgi:hypothetical protein
VAIGRASGGTPAKPGFRRSRKCAQMKSFLYLLVFYKEKHYTQSSGTKKIVFAAFGIGWTSMRNHATIFSGIRILTKAGGG